MAMSVSHFLNFTLLTLLIAAGKTKAPRESFFMPDSTSFTKLGEFLKIGIPQGILNMTEWGYFEMQTLFAGWLTQDETSSAAILINFYGIYCSIYCGLGIATGQNLGNWLGEGNLNVAR